MAKGVYKLRSEKIKLPGPPPPADSLSLSMPDWSVDINKIRRETESAGGNEPGNLIFFRSEFVNTFCHEYVSKNSRKYFSG